MGSCQLLLHLLLPRQLLELNLSKLRLRWMCQLSWALWGKQNKGFGLLTWLWLQLSESLQRIQFCRSWNSRGCNQNDAHLSSVKPWAIWGFLGVFFCFLMFREKGSLLRSVWASLQLSCWSLQNCWNLLMSCYCWTHREYHRAHFVWVFLIWIFNVLH